MVAFVGDEERRWDDPLASAMVSVLAKDSEKIVECSFDEELETDEVEEGEHPKLAAAVAAAVDSYHEGSSYRR